MAHDHIDPTPNDPPVQMNTQENHRRVTLQDVARLAGVNVSTASDALKGTGRVAPATREKVRKIATESNYVPNLAARALVTGRTGTVAIVSGSLNQYYYANMVYRLETLLAAQGYKTLLLGSRREVRDFVTTTEASAVDGVIAIDMYHLIDEFLRAENQVRPAVFVGTYSPNTVDHVTIDLSGAVEAALTIMLKAGRKRVAYLVNSEPMANASEVRAGTYLSVLEKAGRAPEIINLLTDVNLVRSRLKEYIELNGQPDGLLCQNDETALYAYRALMDLGFKVPEDVLLVGCDGMQYLECFETPISTIVQPLDEVCEAALQFLQCRMRDHAIPLQHTTVQAHLVVRESLGVPIVD